MGKEETEHSGRHDATVVCKAGEFSQGRGVCIEWGRRVRMEVFTHVTIIASLLTNILPSLPEAGY